MAGNLKQLIRLFCARHRLLWPQASSDRWRLRKYLARALSCWTVRQNRSWRGLHALRVLDLCALCRQASLYTAQPHPHCFLRHKEGACAGSTSCSAVSLTTNDMEKSSSAGICNPAWLAIGWSLQSQINAQVRQTTFWDTHRSSCSGDLRQATDRFAQVDEEIIEVVTVYEQAREVQVAGDNGVVDTIQDEADETTPLPESKIRLIGPAWSSD